MTTTIQARRFPRLLVLAPLLVGSVLARQDASLSTQMAAMNGSGLTIAECRDRLQQLGTMLDGAGYGTVHTQTLHDGTLASRWYHQATKKTVLAFSGQNAVGNALSVGEHDGLIRMNELIALP